MTLDKLLTPERQQAIRKEMQETRQWTADEFECKWVNDWDHARLPVLAASHKRLPSAVAYHYAILPSGKMVSALDPNAFAAIVHEVFAKPSPSDAALIAKTAGLFAHFGVPIGRVITQFPGAVTKPPARGAQPVHKKDGPADLFLFYSYDFEDPALYDCEVRIEAGAATLRAQPVR